jgi:hypothetical protein
MMLVLLAPSSPHAATIRVPADEPAIQHGINAAAEEIRRCNAAAGRFVDPS